MLTGITLAIGHAGLHFLYRTQSKQRKIQPRMLLASHKYSHIQKWITAKSGKVFSFYLDHDDLCFVVNQQASYIEVLVREYIFEFMEVTKMMQEQNDGKLPISPARSRQHNSSNENDSNYKDTSSNDLDNMAKEIISILCDGNTDFVRMPYDNFEKFYIYSNGCLSNDTCDDYLDSISIAPRVTGSPINVDSISKALANLSNELKERCLKAAKGVDLRTSVSKESKTAPDSLPVGWELVNDPESGSMYYYHTASGASQWTAPTDVKEVDNEATDAWVELEDPSTGKLYFFNELTGETSWHPMNSDGTIAEDDVNEKIQPAAPSTSSRRSSMAFAFDSSDTTETGNLETVVEDEEEDGEEDEDDDDDDDDEFEDNENMDLGGNEWAQMIDESTGNEYYVNNVTGESQWEMPEDAWSMHETDDGRSYSVNSITGKLPLPTHSPS
jgi:hypothetical protein